MASVHVQRWMTIVLDCSEAMTDMADMLPSRLVRATRLLQVFVLRFFDKNPLSQVQIILTADGLAVPLTPLSGTQYNDSASTNLPGNIGDFDFR